MEKGKKTREKRKRKTNKKERKEMFYLQNLIKQSDIQNAWDIACTSVLDVVNIMMVGHFLRMFSVNCIYLGYTKSCITNFSKGFRYYIKCWKRYTLGFEC